MDKHLAQDILRIQKLEGELEVGNVSKSSGRVLGV